MNTFLPYENYVETAKVLDSLRLNSCINESLVILRSLSHVYDIKERTQLSGFEGHTLGKFWKGHELQLAKYGQALVTEYFNKIPKEDTDAENFQRRKERLKKWNLLVEYMEDLEWEDSKPILIGDESFHSGFRAFLLYKDIQLVTFRNWKHGLLPQHAVTRNLLPKKSSWKREDYINIWEIFGRPEPSWYGQWGWTEEPDDMKFFYSEDKRPQMEKEIERKIERPVVGFLRT